MEEPDNKQIFFVGDENVLYRPSFTFADDRSEDRKEEVSVIKIGVCAMGKKSSSKPMKEILKRLERFEYIEVMIFEEEVILNTPIENWPVVDVLMSFFSTGFPLDKAIAYKNLHNVYVVNDLESQKILLDRRDVYQTLVREGIPHPRYAVFDLDNGTSSRTYTHSEDSIEIGGVVFQKPFVEKPVSAEDHNVYIYFPVAAGGGSQRLFRKVGSRSSVYSPVNHVRTKGSYIYEDFMPTDGTDVKVYTVGPDYAHAEARKSPALDGKVERDKEGKEIRYPVILSAEEKVLARKVCLAFKQTVCGFDLLRASGKSYVCDVNGFSFVKNSVKYYDDCAKILGTMIMRALAPQRQIPWVLGAAPEDIPVVPTTSGSMMELRSVVAVMRHGDRTPKQKMKMEVKHKKFFDLFKKYDGYRTGHLKLKKPKQLQEVLDIARFLLSENQVSSDPEIAEKKVKLQQLKLVLEMYGHFSGINRKVQLKYQPYGHPKKSSSEEDELPRQPSLLLIVKWGGELTPAGKIQAEDLGKAFRTLYPGGQGQFEAPGLGFLRLHSTFRHDLKIYASDEGRVQMTAAAFAKGLLALEGELTPILVQMVKSANTNGLLDKQGETSKYQHIVKERLMNLLNEDKDFTEESYDKLAPMSPDTIVNAMRIIKNPKKMCEQIHSMVRELTTQIRKLMLEHRNRDLKLYHGESWELLIRRWAKLEKDFRMKDGRFDISKIPDIYDCIKYDLQHNLSTLQYSKAEELFKCSRAMADIIIPQEYGITMSEKQHISQSVCTPLMRKIRSDLQQCVNPFNEEESTRLNSKYSKDVASPERFVRTRLYFTSESHIHSLLNMLRYGGLCDEMKDEQWKKAMEYVAAIPELNYMTQIVIMMFEDPSKELTSDERFHIELHFSPGALIKAEVVEFPHGSGCRTIAFKDKNMKGKEPVPEEKENLGGSKETLLPDSPRRLYSERPHSSQIVIQETVEELNEAELFNHGCHDDNTQIVDGSPKQDLPTQAASATKYDVPEPRSPDPNVPEWDWGDDSEPKEAGEKSAVNNTTEVDGNAKEKKKLEIKIPSEPIEIQSPRQPKALTQGENVPLHSSDPSSGGTLVSNYGYEPVRSQSFEEKRSRSLEDKQDVKEPSALEDRHYLTVHLPIASTKQRHSWSNFFFVNPEAMQDFEDMPTLHRAVSVASALCQSPSGYPGLIKGYSPPDPPSPAFGGFNMVPTLRPLETLHNKLTMKDLDDFLLRATTSKFITPLSSPPQGSWSNTPVVSPRPLLQHKVKLGQSLPSSSNSSAGPSSPTSVSTPIDLVSQLRLYIMDSKMQQESESLMGKRIRTRSEGSERFDRTMDSTPSDFIQTPNSENRSSSQHDSYASTPDFKYMANHVDMLAEMKTKYTVSEAETLTSAETKPKYIVSEVEQQTTADSKQKYNVSEVEQQTTADSKPKYKVSEVEQPTSADAKQKYKVSEVEQPTSADAKQKYKVSEVEQPTSADAKQKYKVSEVEQPTSAETRSKYKVSEVEQPTPAEIRSKYKVSEVEQSTLVEKRSKYIVSEVLEPALADTRSKYKVNEAEQLTSDAKNNNNAICSVECKNDVLVCDNSVDQSVSDGGHFEDDSSSESECTLRQTDVTAAE